ncbi:MAG: CaiB/BaiF CoA transferase family protein [Dehalococcoidia bacterium]
MQQALEGIRVLDLTRYISGPYCCMLLADMGAEVIRVERPGGDDDRSVGPFAPNGESMLVMVSGRNKRGITLNLRHEEGQGVLKELVRASDVLVENYAPGYLDSLGLGYEALRQGNPSLIYAAISAFGQTGPQREHSGFDAIAQAMSGMMWLTGFPDSPPLKAGLPVVDYGTGIYTALAILLALRHRDQTGEGQFIDTSLLDTALSFLETVPAEYQVLGWVRPQIGNRRPFTAPTDSYQARDSYVCIGTATDSAWRRLARILERPELAQEPRFATNDGRATHQQELNALVADWVADRSVAQVVETLRQAHIPVGPVQTVTEVMADPQIRAREMLVELEQPGVGTVLAPGIPMKLSKTPGTVRRYAPRVGEDNQQVYQGLLGYDPQRMTQLQEEGVI